MSKDLYQTHQARIDTIIGQREFWTIIHKLAFEHRLNGGAADTFDDDLEREYGVKLHRADGYYILPEYTVTDEHKFLILMLKFTGKNG